MKKKITKTKKKKPVKQKIDVVLESLLNLEYRMKELIKEVESLKKAQSTPYYPPLAPMPTNPQPKYWPNVPHKDDITYTFHN